ncbi:MAG: hypothetical protein M3R27_13580 [Bacteroidota bacterium]|nr:hypothetical protein [Bacteroidota bacterium]
MKNKTILFSFLLIVLFSAVAVALPESDTLRLRTIEKPKKKFPYQPLVIKTSPTAWLWGGVFPLTSEYRLMAEITTGRTQSEQVSISLLGKNPFLGAIERAVGQPSNYVFKVGGWKFTYAHKFYLISRRKFAPFGFYVAPLISYTDARVSIGVQRHYQDVYYNFKHFSADLIIGVQVGKKGRLTMDIYGGGGYKNNKLYYHTPIKPLVLLDTKDFGEFYNSNTHVVFGINLGYSF